jgi:hypothetical protein
MPSVGGNTADPAWIRAGLAQLPRRHASSRRMSPMSRSRLRWRRLAACPGAQRREHRRRLCRHGPRVLAASGVRSAASVLYVRSKPRVHRHRQRHRARRNVQLVGPLGCRRAHGLARAGSGQEVIDDFVAVDRDDATPSHSDFSLAATCGRRRWRRVDRVAGSPSSAIAYGAHCCSEGASTGGR